ncbi:MAG: peptide deformylase [bacterium]|nr:peptide deformylase [bacterium]
MAVKIVDRDNPVLRQVAKEIPVSDITKPRIKETIKKMKEVLDAEEDGVGLAAPQIGVSLRIFIISEKAFDLSEDIHQRREELRKSKTVKTGNLVFINPRIVKISKETHFMEEGCLSVRWAYGRIKRSKKTTVEAYDEDGKKFTRGASGLVAEIFQHEMDHLEGKLFIDSATDIREMPPERNLKTY